MRCYDCKTEITSTNGNEAEEPKITEVIATDEVTAHHSDVTVAVGVALCVVIVVMATIFIWHSSRHADCTVGRSAAFKMASVTVEPPAVVAGNNNVSAKQTTTPSSGAILVPDSASCGRAHGRQKRATPTCSERRVVIGRSASRAGTGARDDVTSISPALHVSLNRLPLGDLLGPTNYIPYRLKQSYC